MRSTSPVRTGSLRVRPRLGGGANLRRRQPCSEQVRSLFRVSVCRLEQTSRSLGVIPSRGRATARDYRVAQSTFQKFRSLYLVGHLRALPVAAVPRCAT